MKLVKISDPIDVFQYEGRIKEVRAWLKELRPLWKIHTRDGKPVVSGGWVCKKGDWLVLEEGATELYALTDLQVQCDYEIAHVQ